MKQFSGKKAIFIVITTVGIIFTFHNYGNTGNNTKMGNNAKIGNLK